MYCCLTLGDISLRIEFMVHLCFPLVTGAFFLPHTALRATGVSLLTFLSWKSQIYLCKGISSNISP